MQDRRFLIFYDMYEKTCKCNYHMLINNEQIPDRKRKFISIVHVINSERHGLTMKNESFQLAVEKYE